MITTNATVNEPVKIYYQSNPYETGVVTVINNGSLLTSTATVVESDVPGVYVITFTPTITGRTALIVGNTLVAYVDVTTRSVMTILKNIEDEALGSWIWDKQSGKLNMVKQDGSPLAVFDVVESLTTASRERTS